MTRSAHFRRERRRFLGILGGGVLWCVLPGCRAPSSAPLTVSAHVWPGYEFLFLAQREQVLDGKLVTLHETASATESLFALREGKVDAAALTLDEVLRARAAGTALSVVLVFDISAGADIVLARTEIRQLHDLKGRRIGVEVGALGSFMLVKALQAAKLRRDEVEIVELTQERQEAAWQRREIDALVCYPPVSSKLIADGAVSLFDSRSLPDTIVDVLAVRPQAVADKGEALRHLVAAHFRMQQQLTHSPQDSAFRMAHHLGLPAGEVLPAFRGMLLPDREYNHRLLGGDTPVLQASAATLSEVMFTEGLLPRLDRLEGLMNDEFLGGGQDD